MSGKGAVNLFSILEDLNLSFCTWPNIEIRGNRSGGVNIPQHVKLIELCLAIEIPLSFLKLYYDWVYGISYIFI